MLPRLSNLLMATKSAKSNMSIFSSWVAAPYSLVITYSVVFAWSMIWVSDWPMPLVSTMIRSKPAALQISMLSRTCSEMERLAWRVAKLRM